MTVAIPAAAMIEPLSANNSSCRFESIRGTNIRLIEPRLKQIAATGAMRPGLDILIGI